MPSAETLVSHTVRIKLGTRGSWFCKSARCRIYLSHRGLIFRCFLIFDILHHQFSEEHLQLLWMPMLGLVEANWIGRGQSNK